MKHTYVATDWNKTLVEAGDDRKALVEALLTATGTTFEPSLIPRLEHLKDGEGVFVNGWVFSYQRVVK